jgi:hypothetical protein
MVPQAADAARFRLIAQLHSVSGEASTAWPGPASNGQPVRL